MFLNKVAIYKMAPTRRMEAKSMTSQVLGDFSTAL